MWGQYHLCMENLIRHYKEEKLQPISIRDVDAKILDKILESWLQRYTKSIINWGAEGFDSRYDGIRTHRSVFPYKSNESMAKIVKILFSELWKWTKGCHNLKSVHSRKTLNLSKNTVFYSDICGFDVFISPKGPAYAQVCIYATDVRSL